MHHYATQRSYHRKAGKLPAQQNPSKFKLHITLLPGGKIHPGAKPEVQIRHI